MAHATTSTGNTGERRHRAGLFDIRTFIGALLGLYGLILVLTGLIGTDDQELAKTDDFNINLWAGVGLVVAGIVFITWVRLRPVVVPDDPQAADVAEDQAGDRGARADGPRRGE